MSYVHLTHTDRVALGALHRAGHSQSHIATLLGKHRSTISRELRNKGAPNKSGYDAKIAERNTVLRRARANHRFRKIEHAPELERYIVNKLRQYWSPEQIAGRLESELGTVIVGHVTIYSWIRSHRPDLRVFLRCQKGRFRLRYGTKKRGKVRDEGKKKRIDVRPAIVERRERIGDWEGDFILGQEKTKAILTHVERKSGYLLADKIEELKSQPVKDAIVGRLRSIPKHKRHTVTYDNDKTLTLHDVIEKKTKTDVYFAHPYHSWERGTNENTNGLLRQFFPKKTPFATLTQGEINKKVWLLNARPRKRLKYLTPAEVFNDCCTLD